MMSESKRLPQVAMEAVTLPEHKDGPMLVPEVGAGAVVRVHGGSGRFQNHATSIMRKLLQKINITNSMLWNFHEINFCTAVISNINQGLNNR